MTPRRTLLLIAVAALAVPASAWPESEEEREREEAEAGILKPLHERPFNQAREENGVKRRPRSRHPLPGGELNVSAERLAASRQPVRFRLELDRAADRGKLVLLLPQLWVRRSAVSGLPFARVPGGRRTVVLDASDPTLVIDNVGIPAGTYEVQYRLRRGGDTAKAGVARVVLYAPVREQHAPTVFTDGLRAPVNATANVFEESEAFIAVGPANSDRVIAGINSNDIDPCCSAWISDNRGATYTKATLPTLTDAPGTAIDETQEIGGDPMHAADDQGNLWYGNLTLGGPGATPNRIVVNRVPAGTTTFQAKNVGLRFDTNGFQDKNLMAIDMHPTSPTYGRLYVVWGDPAGGGVDMVIVQCDTRPGGVLNAANCDNADNWSVASKVASNGSFIYADVAVGPDGKVYVTWWDYSSNNAIRGKVCDPTAGASLNCDSTTDWNATSISTIATLDATGGTPIDFACPIVAQPGGRAGPAPQVEVADSDGATGRVYVTWSDLKAGSGTTRCDGFTDPALTHLTWDSFVASVTGALPGGANPSTSVGTRLYTDGEGGAASSNSDEWFPWLSVDQSTGQAYADFYSTRDDTTRQTTHFYMRAVTPSGGINHSLGSLLRVSSAASDYSFISPCCQFSNEYGDYEGLDAAEGSVFPVWTDNSTGDGEAFTVVPTLSIVPQSTTFTETAGDGDGIAEAGEEGDLGVVVVNNSTAGATGTITGTLSESHPDVTVTQGSSTYPTPLRATLTGTSVTAYHVQFGPGTPCGPVTLTLGVTATQQDTGGPINTGGSVLLPVLSLPCAVSGLTATGLEESVLLDWADTPGASSYDIFRKAGDTYPVTPTATSTVSTYTDAGLPAGTEQCYKVRATNAAGSGPDSSEACATPTAPGAGGGGGGGGGSGGGGGGGGTVEDTSAPDLTVGGKKRQRIGRTRAVTVTAVCADERCTLSATGTVSVPGVARTFKLRGATGSVAAGATVKLKLRLRRKTVRAVRKALRARRRVRARISVRAVDAAGNARVASITVRARR